MMIGCLWVCRSKITGQYKGEYLYNYCSRHLCTSAPTFTTCTVLWFQFLFLQHWHSQVWLFQAIVHSCPDLHYVHNTLIPIPIPATLAQSSFRRPVLNYTISLPPFSSFSFHAQTEGLSYIFPASLEIQTQIGTHACHHSPGVPWISPFSDSSAKSLMGCVCILSAALILWKMCSLNSMENVQC